MCLCDSWRNCCVCPFFIVVFGHCVGTVGTAANEGSLCLLGEKQRVPEGKMFGHVGLKFWNGQRTNISHCCTGRLQGRHIYKKKTKKVWFFEDYWLVGSHQKMLNVEQAWRDSLATARFVQNHFHFDPVSHNRSKFPFPNVTLFQGPYWNIKNWKTFQCLKHI